jgi:hypothetical protein
VVDNELQTLRQVIGYSIRLEKKERSVKRNAKKSTAADHSKNGTQKD